MNLHLTTKELLMIVTWGEEVAYDTQLDAKEAALLEDLMALLKANAPNGYLLEPAPVYA